MEPLRVIYHHEPEGWWADSPDVTGYTAAAPTYEEVRALVEEGLLWAAQEHARDAGSAVPPVGTPLEHYVPAPA